MSDELVKLQETIRRLQLILNAGLDYTRMELDAYDYVSMIYFLNPTASYSVEGMKVLSQFLRWENSFDFTKIHATTLTSAQWFYHVDRLKKSPSAYTLFHDDFSS